MSRSSVGNKPIGFHLPRIELPRNSVDIRRDVEKSVSGDGATIEKISSVALRKIEESDDEILPVIKEPIKVMPTINVGQVLDGLDPSNDISIAQVVSNIKTRKSCISMHVGGPKNSLFQHILKAKSEENKRIRKTIQKSKDQVKKRWQMSKNAVIGPLSKDEISQLNAVNKVRRSSSSRELVELNVMNKSDVETLQLSDQKERSPNARGLKMLAKIFNKDRGSVSDTPTIFALLRASHIVSVAVVTHQQRESEEDELTAYEQTLNNYLAFLPDLSIVNTIRSQNKTVEEFEGVAMFADVSGFTVLCATYGTVNISKLKEILNLVMGNIVDEILMSGGDIVSFAGDAIFAVWRTHSIEERSSILPKILKCSIHIQDAVNLAVDKSITLRVKVGLAVGKMFSFYLSSSSRDHIAVVGPAVKDVNKAEGCCIAGNIVCSQGFFDEFPHKERYPSQPSKPGYVQLWPPKNNSRTQVTTLLDNLGNGSHVTLDRLKVVRKISDDMVKQDLLKRYIPDYLRFQLQEGQGTSWASQVRTITTLFISLVFADSEKVSNDYYNVQDALICIDEIVDKMNGTVNKIFTFDKGCTILVAFGTQGFKMNDDPRRALKTAQMILPSLQNKVTDFKGVSIGVTTGLCFCGVVGHEDRHEYTVIGHQVNLACRLMSNYPFCVACDESTKRLSTLPESAFTALPPKVLKGVPPGGLYFKYSDSSVTEEMYEIRGSLSSASRQVRMVGRAREIDALYASIVEVENSAAGKAQNAIIIEAQAGFGKSRLLEQYAIIGERRNFRVIMVPLVMDEMTTPFFAVKMIMFKLLELGKSAHHHNKEGVIARYVPEYLRSDMCLLNDILGTKFKRESSRDYSYKNLHKLLKVLLKEIVGDQSYLFIIDNVMYMDQQSWEFLFHLINSRKKIILAVSMRRSCHKFSRAESQLISSPRAKTLVLNSFNQDEVEEFCKAVLNVKNVPKEVVKILSEKTRGIPQYCEGLLKNMLKEQVIRVVDDMETYKAIRSVSHNSRGSTSRASKSGMGQRFSIFSQNSKSSKAMGTSLIRKQIIEEDEDEEEFSIDLPGTAEPTFCCGGGLHRSDSTDQVSSFNEAENSDDVAQTADCRKICILNESVNLSAVALPDSLKELFLAQFDRLAVTEQVTMKCCAVLGTHFSVSLLKSVLPHRTPAQINHSVRIMIREQLLECGGGMRIADECGNKMCRKRGAVILSGVLENSPICETMRFTTQFSAEILRDLLLPEQRIRIHETAARVLEKKIMHYDFCCKKEFFGNVFKISAMGETEGPTWVQKARDRRKSIDSGELQSCQCHSMFTSIYPQIIRHYKAAGTNHSVFEALCSAGALGMALSFTFEAITYLEDALSLFKGRTKLTDKHRACLSSLLCLAMYSCPTPTTIKLYKEALQLGGHAQVVYKYNVSCLSYLCGKEKDDQAVD